MDLATYDQMAFGTFLVIALLLFYQSWVNLVKKRLTNFSLDALILRYVLWTQGKKSHERARRLIREEPKRLRSLGIIALVMALSMIYQAVVWYIKHIG